MTGVTYTDTPPVTHDARVTDATTARALWHRLSRHDIAGAALIRALRAALPTETHTAACYFCHGDASRRQQSWGYRVACFEQSARRHTRQDVAFTNWYFGYCLVSWADRPPPEDGSESAPFRPILPYR